MAKAIYKYELHFIGRGQVSGRVIGGNLSTMAGIWGSEYMPEIQSGDILLIEDSLKGIEAVERSFAHLLACGVFDKVGALVLGKHELFDDKVTGRVPHDVLLEVLNCKNVPILYGFDSCHTHPMLVTPLGVQGTIDCVDQTFKLQSQWLASS